VRRPDFLRAKESARNAVTHAFQFSGDFMEAESKMRVHVFEEDLLGLAFADDARDVRPEVARIFVGELLARTTERLARIARAEDVRLSAIGRPVEGFKVAPNVGSSQGAVLKTRNQLADNRDFPFHVHERANCSESERKSEVDASVSGAEGDDVRYNHIHAALPRLPCRFDFRVFILITSSNCGRRRRARGAAEVSAGPTSAAAV
jgi:hypothetical protein